MEFRPALVSDCNSLSALSIEVWVGTYLRDGVGDVFADYVLNAFTPEHFRTVICDPDHALIVASLPGGPVGFVQISTNKPCPVAGGPAVELAHLYVQPRHARKGIGRALLERAMQHEMTRAAGGVWLIANVENTKAQSFYGAHEFLEIGAGGFEIDGVAYPQVIMARKL